MLSVVVYMTKSRGPRTWWKEPISDYAFKNLDNGRVERHWMYIILMEVDGCILGTVITSADVQIKGKILLWRTI